RGLRGRGRIHRFSHPVRHGSRPDHRGDAYDQNQYNNCTALHFYSLIPSAEASGIQPFIVSGEALLYLSRNATKPPNAVKARIARAFTDITTTWNLALTLH